MKRLLAPVVGVGSRFAVASAAAAALMLATAADAADQVSLTVYNSDLALVKETRTVELPDGTAEFSFTGVPQRIDPTTVRLTAGQGLTVLEQNYRYDLVSREKLLERYLDQPARIVTKHDKLHEGILKTAMGSLVLETADGVVLLSNDEIADITCFVLSLANALELDLSSAVERKIAKNAAKYPVATSRGRYFKPGRER